MKVDKIKDIISIIPYNEKVITQSKAPESSVLLPIVEKEGKLYILFEKRSQWVSQPGEICFPGGRVDDTDEDHLAAAVRETCEELGYLKEQIQVLGKLGVMPTHYRNVIHCYVGFIHWDQVEQNRYNQKEVEEVILVDLDHLLETDPEIYTLHLKAEAFKLDDDGNEVETFPAEKLGLPPKYHGGWNMGTRKVISYELDNIIIWGLTGSILQHFLDNMKNI